MAYNNLLNEADSILDICWGKSSAANELRKLANQIIHVFSMSEELTVTALMKERVKIPKKNRGPERRSASDQERFDWKWGAHKFEGQEQLIQKFSKALIEEISLILNKKPDEEAELLKPTKPGEIRFTVKGSNPYNTLRDIKGEASAKVINSNAKYQKLFGTTSVTDIGHVEGIAKMKAGVTGNFWEGQESEQEPPDTSIDTSFQTTMREIGLKAYNEQMEALLPDLAINHYTTASLKNGKLEGVKEILADLDGDFHNQVIQANTRLENVYSENEIGKKTKAAHVAAQAAIKKYYESLGGQRTVEQENSTPFIDSMKAMFLGPSIRKIASKATLSKLKVKEPKSSRPRRAPARKKIKPLELRAQVHSAPISALGGLPKSKPKQRKGASESSNSVASLYALLNAKLPQTVAKNMGPPGLESQSGRFASSVRVTDVNRTAQGFPSVGYTYQKNPYQVFEMGRGTAPWATTARDPRTLIDASIREVAMQLAVGRFYTRRV